MSKVSRHNSLKSLKSNAEALVSNANVVTYRHAKFQGFMTSLKADKSAVSIVRQDKPGKENVHG